MAKKAAVPAKKPQKAGSKPPKGEAKPLGTPAPKAHERKAKPSEIGLLARGKALAITYLEQRDGMPTEVATMVIESMDPMDVNALIEEANTKTIDNTKLTPSQEQSAAVEDDPGPLFTEVPALVANATFPTLVIEARQAAQRKNEAEKEYKDKKKQILAMLKAAKIDRVQCAGVKLAVYVGHTVMLNEQKLLELGVAPETVKAGYKDTPYDDVRFTDVKVEE